MLLEELFNIIKSDDGLSYKIQLSNKEHPIFKAHFPKKPILPAFIQMDISAKLFNLNFKKIKKAKFIKIIEPEEILDFDLNSEKKRIIISKDSKKVSEFSYE